MAEIFEFTLAQLAEAFKRYNAEVAAHPEQFGFGEMNLDEIAMAQAEKLISCLVAEDYEDDEDGPF